MNELLNNLNACNEAKVWAKDKSWKEIFETCYRGDWLLWLFKKTMINNEDNLRKLTLAKAHCANTVRKLMKNEKSLDAVDMAIKFGNNEASREELKFAAYDAAAAAAYAYAAAADADADAYAAPYAADAAAAAAYAYAYADAYAADAYAYADAYAADAAAAAAYAADAAAAAADAAAAAAAADADAAVDAKKQNQLETANICRKYLPIEIWNINIEL